MKNKFTAPRSGHAIFTRIEALKDEARDRNDDVRARLAELEAEQSVLQAITR